VRCVLKTAAADYYNIHEDGNIGAIHSFRTGGNSVSLDIDGDLVLNLQCDFITYMVIDTGPGPDNTNLFYTNVEFVYRRVD
jgi:hypothetical protein